MSFLERVNGDVVYPYLLQKSKNYFYMNAPIDNGVNFKDRIAEGRRIAEERKSKKSLIKSFGTKNIK